MKVLLFFVVMVAMLAMLMAQENDAAADVKCSRGESFLCFLKCIAHGKLPENCDKVNGTLNCVCRVVNATSPE